MRAKYEKPQIGKDEDGEKVVSYVSVGEKVILVGKIDKTQAGRTNRRPKAMTRP